MLEDGLVHPSLKWSRILQQIQAEKRMTRLITWVEDKINQFLIKESSAPKFPLNNFAQLQNELQVADVILVEGRSRVSQVIKYITQSQWSHAALYLGNLDAIKDPEILEHFRRVGVTDTHEQWVVESLLGDGMVLTPLKTYAQDNLRICRPQGLTKKDGLAVVRFCTSLLGIEYDVRQMLDLARFLFPYSIVPKRWRSSLFVHNAGGPTRTVCSTVIARAFMEVQFPILPVIKVKEDGEMRIAKRNPKLFTPRDFDYSPYFTIIKHPLIELPRSKYQFLQTEGAYRKLPWSSHTKIGGGSLAEGKEAEEIERIGGTD